MVPPWERLPGESTKAFAAFCVYRDLGLRRSIDEASRHYHGSGREGTAGTRPRPGARASGIIRRWAQSWHWRARAEAWDEEQGRVKASQRVAAALEMNERHVREALMLQNKAIERLRQLHPEDLKPRELLDFLVESAKLERLAMGEPTDRVSQEHTFPDLEELSDDELAAFIARGREQILLAHGRGAAPQTECAQEPP